MSWTYEKETGDIVFKGIENGIAPSPEQGIGDMRSVNIISIPGEASVSYSTVLNSQTSLTNIAITGTAANDTITYSGTAVNNGAAVVFSGGSLPGNIVAGTVYWAGNATSTTFKVYSDPYTSSLIDINSDGSGTFSTVNVGEMTYTATGNPSGVAPFFMIDINGRAWGYLTAHSMWTFLGNTTLTNASGNGIGYYQASDGTGYLFVLRNAVIDYAPVSTFSWTFGWQNLNTASGVANSHYSLVGQDNVFYFCDAGYVGSFFEKSGSTFDPSSSATYTFNNQALKLPPIDIATCLAELGVNLLITGIRNIIYPWNRISPTFNYPLMIAENTNNALMTGNLPRMVTVNTKTFIFTGNRGRIYVTNGSQIDEYLKVPDSISGAPEPLFRWRGFAFARNQLYFGISGISNTGSTLTNYGGVWAIDLKTEALRVVNQLSYGTYAGFAAAILPANTGVSGPGFFCAWFDGTSTYGVDAGTTTPYTSFATATSYIDFDLVPIGTFFKKRTFSQIEFKLSKPLTSGEGVKISYRSNLTDSFTTISQTTTAGLLSDGYTVNFETVQWIQLRAELRSTVSSPSYTRLTELRLR